MDLKDKDLFIQKCFINGHWLDAESEETFDVMNPSDQTKVGTMPNCSKKDTVKAIEAAKKSWNKWKKLPAFILVMIEEKKSIIIIYT